MVAHSRSASPQYYDHTLTKADRDTMAEVGILAEGLLNETNPRGRNRQSQTPHPHSSLQIPTSPEGVVSQSHGFFNFGILGHRPHSMRALIAQVSILSVVVTLCLVFLEEGYLPDMKTETLKLDAFHSVAQAMSEKSIICSLTAVELRSEEDAIIARDTEDVNSKHFRAYQSLDILPQERLRRLSSERGITSAIISDISLLKGAQCATNELCKPSLQQLRSAVDNPRLVINKYVASGKSKCFDRHLS